MANDAGSAEKQFLYDAFISYRHVDRDRKWAEWLIAALEGYRVPKALQERGLPPRLRKVFRDEDELPSSADLNDQIKAALHSSRFLIVVCSAFTPRSKWVEREIQIFNELGRGDQVLALLTEGEPADSFPDAMLVRRREVTDPDGSTRIVKEDKEPLAADVRPRPGVSAETAKRLALLRLVAVILGVKFDDLRQREHEREHKRHLTWAAAAAALVVLIGGAGGFYWNMVRPHTGYYRNLIWRWGLPEGAWPIDSAIHARLPHSYSVVTQRGKVIEIRYDGWLVSQADEARWVVRYGDDGSAQKIQNFSETGRLLKEQVFSRVRQSNKLIVSFEREGISSAQDATHDLMNDPTQANQGPGQSKSEISRHELTFDGNGFPVEIRYEDSWGTPQHDAQGSFGERYTYSPEGLVLRSSEIGPNGEDITLKNGVHAVTSTYDSDGRLVQRTLLGDDGRPINGSEGYAYFVRDYHPSGDDADTVQTYYGADGKPTLSRDGYATLLAKHDEHGNNTEVAFAGTDGKLITVKNGYAVMQRKFDDRGRVVAEAYFDINRRPTFGTSGIAADTVSYDQINNITEINFLGVDGNPTINKAGYAKVTRKYDTRSNLVDEAYFGVSGKPTLNTNDCAEVKQVFDARDQRIELAYLDVNGRPTLSKEGLADIKYTYDPRGNETKREFLGTDGKPVVNLDGISGFRQTFDDRGLKTSTSYFGMNGEPALSRVFGYAEVHYSYDIHGNATEIDHLGVDGKPILAKGGIATYRVTFDDRGRMIEINLFGLDGRPAASFEGVARTRVSYDSRGNVAERDFFGIDGKPTLGRAGNAGVRFKYDAEGNLVETTSLGIDGKPILNPSGIAISRQSFDGRHNRIELSYFGVDGRPIKSNESIAKTVYAYDAHGNAIDTAFFGLDGKPTLGIGGFARVIRKFDDRNNVVKQTYLGIDGKPINVQDGGYAEVIWSYGARGNLLKESYFGSDGKPAHADGAVTIKYNYDDLGRQPKVTYFDPQGHELQMELVIRRIVPGGIGAQAGLKPGDHLLSYNGQPVNSVKQLVDLVTGGTYPFRTVTIRRDSQVITFQVERGLLGINIGLANVHGPEAAAVPPPVPAPSR